MDRRVWSFWTGDNQLTENRKKSCESLAEQCEKSNVQYTLITKDNLKDFLADDKYFHEAYDYLTPVHKADYLKSYIGFYYGGFITDIKPLKFDFNEIFDHVESNPNIEVYSYHVTDIHHLNFSTLSMIDVPLESVPGNYYFYIKNHSLTSRQYFLNVNNILDKKLNSLKIHPPKSIYDRLDKNDPNSYPIQWSELGAEFNNACIRSIHRGADIIDVSMKFQEMNGIDQYR